MTVASFSLIFFVSLVNLSLGFGAAALVGRGPWSTRARALQTVPDNQTSAEPEVPTSEQPDEVGQAMSPSDKGNERAVVHVPSIAALTGQARQSMQRVASGLEFIEQELHTLHQQIQASGPTPPKNLLPQWAAEALTQANQLREIHDDFRRPGESENLPDDVLNSLLGSLAHLQQEFEMADIAIGRPENTTAERCTAVNSLLTACQEARGKINAVAFFQSQP